MHIFLLGKWGILFWEGKCIILIIKDWSETGQWLSTYFLTFSQALARLTLKQDKRWWKVKTAVNKIYFIAILEQTKALEKFKHHRPFRLSCVHQDLPSVDLFQYKAVKSLLAQAWITKDKIHKKTSNKMTCVKCLSGLSLWSGTHEGSINSYQ